MSIPATSAPLVAADNVTKSFAVGKGQVQILHGVSLTVQPSEMVAVMGASGSGKSTFLYCLAGLDVATSGRVSLLGRDISSLNKAELAKMRRREVGFVFQQYNLIPTLTAEQNVALPYRLRKENPPAGLIEATLREVGLGERMKALPPSMSGGEQQRVALARVLAQKPQILFADEPTGALDTKTGNTVLARLQAISKEPGQCVVLVTHDPKVAAACDRVAFMRDGLLVAELAKPTVEQVAQTLAGVDSHA